MPRSGNSHGAGSEVTRSRMTAAESGWPRCSYTSARNQRTVDIPVLPGILAPISTRCEAIGRKMRKRSGLAQERMADLTSILQETIAGARVVKAFGMEPFEQGKFDAANQRFYRAFVRLRQMLASHADLARKLATLEKKYDAQFRVVFDAIRELMTPPEPKKKRPIGFAPWGDK